MRIAPLVLLAFAGVVLLAACDNGGGDGGATPGTTATPGQPEASPTPAFEDVCLPNPDPATPVFQIVFEPIARDTVTSPVTISGQVLAFEATYQIGIFDVAGDPIVETFGTAGPGDAGQLAPFSIDVPFNVVEPTPACIWVYEASARDGSPVHVGQIPVTLSP